MNSTAPIWPRSARIGTHELRWVFRVIAGHENEYESLPTGETFTLPDSTWLRNKIREYAQISGEVDA